MDKSNSKKKSISKNYYEAVGRRKEAIARVRIMPGKGNILVNERSLQDYFKSEILADLVIAPLKLVGLESKFDASIKVKGGGVKGQVEASRHGLARALVEYDSSLRSAMKQGGFLRRDPREKERKKYGFHKARRGRQFRKR